ncbi:MAG: hypothetical protein AAFU68_04110 [Pseudomonadota bacterium]
MRPLILAAAASLVFSYAAADDRLEDLQERQAETIEALEIALELAKMQSVVIDALRSVGGDAPAADGETGAALFTCRRMGFSKMCEAN